ncbi:MAG TPA: hypothetical protein VFG59_00965, partial [Anaeromyxobacter sp.]|nr:hypothetical protein [Anaeromyxobacter sp.]
HPDLSRPGQHHLVTSQLAHPPPRIAWRPTGRTLLGPCQVPFDLRTRLAPRDPRAGAATRTARSRAPRFLERRGGRL